MGSDWGAAPLGEAAPLLAPGQRFGPYAIVRLLGRGGMGEVYDAEETDSGRRVALKLLNRRLSSRDERDRFLREGRLAAGVSHPHCVYVFGTDEIDGLPTISMELASGGTLKDAVNSRGPLPFRDAVDAILQVTAGLEAAAAAGVLHRDIKPANCFVDDDGSVKVGDFGLSTSTVAGDETHLTLAGTIMGTPAFASPEQMRAEDLDVRSDIYSVGATLYYLLTGRAPFEEANVVRLLAMVVQDMPPAPRTLRKDVPKGLSAIVMRALAKRPGDRFSDYAALRAALEPFGSGAPVPAPIGFRVLAYIVDYLVVGTLSVLALWPLGLVQLTVRSDSGTVLADGAYSPARVIAPLVLWAVYWILLEGLFGASLGKRVFRLRVAGTGGEPAGLGAVLLRYGRLPRASGGAGHCLADPGDPRTLAEGRRPAIRPDKRVALDGPSFCPVRQRPLAERFRGTPRTGERHARSGGAGRRARRRGGRGWRRTCGGRVRANRAVRAPGRGGGAVGPRTVARLGCQAAAARLVASGSGRVCAAGVAARPGPARSPALAGWQAGRKRVVGRVRSRRRALVPCDGRDPSAVEGRPRVVVRPEPGD